MRANEPIMFKPTILFLTLLQYVFYTKNTDINVYNELKK